ncbi:MAG: heterodisulfide reductase-related iron-sulfur binding cluster [Burkholderiaceae bacterium]
MPTHPIRPGFWNIPLWAEIGVYVAGFAAIAIFCWGVWRHVRLWRAGAPELRLDLRPQRIAAVLKEALGQSRILRQPFPGVMHAALLWSFILLFIGTALATLDWDIGKLIFDQQFLQGPTYLIYKLTLDLAGLVFLIGLAMAAWRRFLQRPPQLEASSRFAAMLTALFVIIATGFVIEGARLAVQQPAWAAWSPVGNTLAGVFAATLSPAALAGLHLWTWVFHGLAALVFVALIPFTYFSHIVATPVNIYWQRLRPRGALTKIEAIEEQESFGISRFEQFTWKQRLDFDACTECGRCQAACPALAAGTPLNPKQLIGKLKRFMHEHDGKDVEGTRLIGDVISPDELWACTSCAACVEACPARIDVVGTIVDMRRHLALEQGEFPAGVAHTLQNMQGVGNPWGMDPGSRLDWTQGLDVPLMEEGKPVEFLYWVGCSAAYDQRNQKIARAMVKILQEAGVSFGVLREERCHCDTGRRLGEEYLYQTATDENIGNMRKYQFQRVLAHCPHCFNTIANEYPQFEGGEFEVIHHTQLIADLMTAGKIRPAIEGGQEVVLHDPCYLGRYNGDYSNPRAALDGVQGLVRREAAEHGANATCCGGGGGQMWMDTHQTKHIHVIRLEQLEASGTKNVAVGCPHCLTMLETARAETGELEHMKVRDIAEIVADALPSARTGVAI